jgi:TonB-dependent SusC/RagA subfamily outer membrane receptor
MARPVDAQEVLNQRITIRAEKQSVRSVLNLLQEKTKLRFTYSSAIIPSRQKVTIIADQQPLSYALDQLFEQTNVRYTVQGRQVILQKSEDIDPLNHIGGLKTESTSANAERSISGVVKDSKGEALPGVSVLVKNTQRGTLTDSDGKFQISVPDNSNILVFSYVGFEPKEVVIASQSFIDVALSTDIKSLNEVVVVGYGTARKSDLSAAISTVPDMAQIKNRPVLNVESMIQGKVPGVTAVSNGGHPDKAPSVTIRGMGSRSGESVLYVVDGVPGAPFNPSDVESMTVLKDAASAAIYGAFSGSAGVILITTRQAAQGKPSIEYSGFMGAKQAWRLPHSLNATDEAKVSNLAYTNAGLNPLDGWDATKILMPR